MHQDSRKFKNGIYMQLARVGKALASPRRLEILDFLSQGPKTVDNIAKETDMSVANTSQHLQTLLESRLVVFEKKGLYSYYELADESVAGLIQSLQNVGENLLADIKKLIDEVYSDTGNIEHIDMEQLFERMRSGKVALIDVRPKEEYDLLHIPGASSIPLENLGKEMKNLPLDQEIVAYCRGRYCLLSVEAVALLKSYGYQAVRLEENTRYWSHEFTQED